jgi:hypothetical protein
MAVIKTGTRVHCSLMGGRTGIVFAIQGKPGQDTTQTMAGGAVVISGGSSAHYDVVFDNGTISYKVPECIINGVQWTVLDKPLAERQEIDEALQFAAATKKKAEEEKAEAKRQFDAEVERLRSSDKWSHLQQNDPENPIRGAKFAAKNIRKFLKKEFPAVKFSVRIEGYDCVWVTWPKESSSDEVNQSNLRDLLAIFKTGYFDSMSDCFITEDSPFNVVFGGTKYFTIQPQY